MAIEERIMNDYKEALKNKDQARISTVTLLRSAFKNLAIDKKVEKLEDADAISIVRKQIKQRQDSIEQFTKGNRPDLADKEIKELEILKTYLPQELSAEELKAMIGEAVAATGAAGMKDMGRVMKEVNAKAAGRADGKLVSDLVRERLSKI
ncbi:MAG: GatB/YqeY domain-containing protein [Candidatus Omnitrophota bacterium]